MKTRTRFLAMLILCGGLRALASPVALRCEFMVNPLGMDQAAPRLSWQSDSTERDWKQAAYQILVASNPQQLAAGDADVWDSGRKESGESVGIAYAGPALESRRRYYWKVRVWDSAGQMSESQAAWWEMGLLHAADWEAKWIHRENPEDTADREGMHWIWIPGHSALHEVPQAKAMFRTKVTLTEMPQDAALFLAARGDFRASVNGHDVGGKKGWGALDRRRITSELVVGENVIEVEVRAPESPRWGPHAGAKTMKAAFAGLVKIRYADGTVKRIATDEKWEVRSKDSDHWAAAHVAGDLSNAELGDPGPLPQPAAYLRRTLAIAKEVAGARLYVTALGSYSAYLNGKKIGDDELTPGFTDYRKRVLYQTYDVTGMLASGKNVLGAMVGDGWHGTPLTWEGVRLFTAPNRFRAQLEVEYVGGGRDTFASDATWKAAPSPILRSDVYDGELYDARAEQDGWNLTSFDDSRWSTASMGDVPGVAVSSQIGEAARVVADLKPVTMKKRADGSFVYDMGQNMVGWVRLKMKGAAGNAVKLRFAEILNPDGSIYTENLRNAAATDLYVARGGGEETFEPHFTFHGFRYVELSGIEGTPVLDTIEGKVVSSVSGEPATGLATSSDLVNRMWKIGIWGQRGNFLSVPTDCPQRDERLGWMGDAGVFWRTGSYNFDIAAFSQKFAQDIADAQTAQGAFTNVSPDTLPGGGDGSEGAPGWGDAGVIVPWTTWMQYGDRATIERNWASMQRWMEYIQSRNPDFLRRKGVGPNFADWLAPDGNTNKDLLATAYWALIANMMSEMAHATGKADDAARYDGIVEKIREAFQKAYIKADGEVGTGTQTSYVVALYTKMAPPALEAAMVERLVKDIEAHEWHLTTGFLGTPFLLFTLSDHGRSDVAYRLLLNETYPSWGYMLSKGATTWWERWNGDTGDPSMNSYNHYAFGSVMAWVYRDAAGIDTAPDAPGFKHIVIHPHLDARMHAARAEYDSVYGKIVSDWSGTPAGPFSLKVTVPANTSANVFLPVISGAHATEAGHAVAGERMGDSEVVRVGSGSYSFEVK